MGFMMIELRNLSKTYLTGGVETKALKNVNLTIRDGDYISIVGTSGSGKSTLLNILGCMDAPSEGEYIYDGEKINELNISKLNKFRKEHISFIFQNFSLLNSYTLYENVELPLIARGMSAKERKVKVMEMLELVGLAHLKDSFPLNTSGGQQQRVAIARALVTGNNLILADEPTGALDKNTTKDIMELFEKMKEKGRTLVVVTHDLEIAAMAEKSIQIEDGEVKVLA
jgi:putative ABC transport system ATP-binding protein